MTAFANGLTVDWEVDDPFDAYVATRKEWNLLRCSKAHIERFPTFLVDTKGCSAEAARAIAQKFITFTDKLISEKKIALEQRRDVDFEQYRSELEDLLGDYPCVKHIFWEPFLSVKDMYCALQIRADAFSGKHQRAKRITGFCEFGCASANKGGGETWTSRRSAPMFRPSSWDSSSKSRLRRCVPRASAGRGKPRRTRRALAWGTRTNGPDPRG